MPDQITRNAVDERIWAEELDEFVPQNDGMFRPVDVVAPLGSIFNPRRPLKRSATRLAIFCARCRRTWAELERPSCVSMAA